MEEIIKNIAIVLARNNLWLYVNILPMNSNVRITTSETSVFIIH